MIVQKKHTTNDEKAYIDTIGMYHSNRLIHPKDVLIGYIAGCLKRFNWCDMNGDDVIKYAQAKLATM